MKIIKCFRENFRFNGCVCEPIFEDGAAAFDYEKHPLIRPLNGSALSATDMSHVTVSEVDEPNALQRRAQISFSMNRQLSSWRTSAMAMISPFNSLVWNTELERQRKVQLATYFRLVSFGCQICEPSLEMR